jgi:hypothetical protein
LYPGLLHSIAGAVLISDVDMAPLNRSYYVKALAPHLEEAFVSLRSVLVRSRQLAICYTAATPKTWRELFPVTTEYAVRATLRRWYAAIEYSGDHGGAGWSEDQRLLFRAATAYQHHVVLPDAVTGFRRLCRSAFRLTWLVRRRITAGAYSDFHMLRPQRVHAAKNAEVLELVKPVNP